MENINTPLQQNTGISGIPVGIAFARQRLQDQTNVSLPVKEPNRFGLNHGNFDDSNFSVASNFLLDGNSALTPATSENPFLGLSSFRPSNSFWQYPIAIHDSVLPMSVPPIGFQIVRDPTSGSYICLPSTTNNLDPFHPTVMWPALTQTTTTGQLPHYMYPSVPQSLPTATFSPFQWMGTDYLSSTTLHQHTQTQTRLVAVPADVNRKTIPGLNNGNQIYNNLPIKTEGCNELQIECKTSAMSNFQTNTYSENKISTNSMSLRNIKETITTGVHTKNTCFNKFENFSNESIIENAIETQSNHQPLNITIPLNPSLVFKDIPQNNVKNNLNHTTSDCDICPCITNKQDAIIQTDLQCSSDDAPFSDTEIQSNCSTETTKALCETKIKPFINTDEYEIYDRKTETNNPEINPDIPNYEPPQQEQQQIQEQEISEISTKLVKYKVDNNKEDEMIENRIVEQQNIDRVPVDLSGLELLSNISIEAIGNNGINLKQEIIEGQSQLHLSNNNNTNTEEMYSNEPIALATIIKEENKLEGLNLLCALAEQRIQEADDESDNGKQVTLKTEDDEIVKSRISRKKIGKLKKKKHGNKEKHQNSEDYGSLNKDIKEILTEVKSNYGNTNENNEQKSWPTPEELINTMEVNMRNRLAEISRKFQEKKKELEKITKTASYSKKFCSDLHGTDKINESSSLGSIGRVATPTLPPSNFKLASNNIFQNLNLSKPCPSDNVFVKKCDDIASIDNKTTLNIFGNQIKTPSINLVKPVLSTSVESFDNKDFNNIKCNDLKNSNSISCNFKFTNSNLMNNDDKLVVKFQKNHNSEILGANDINGTKQLLNSSSYEQNSMKRFPMLKKIKEHMKKKHKSTHCEKRQKNIDHTLKITNDHLNQEKTRVLTAMGGLFYAGYLQPIQPPDVYSVTLDGERGNKPHIMCREEVLRDVILEIIPPSVKKVSPGTRICAYWSPQYRCLYPGTAVKTLDSSIDNRFVSVEFDDGDSGKIVLEDVRFLLSDYPIADYNSNPLSYLGKRKLPNTDSSLENLNTSNEFNESKIERCKHNKVRREHWSCDNVFQSRDKKHMQHSEEYCRHKKHKKKKKHKKHHRKKNYFAIKEDLFEKYEIAPSYPERSMQLQNAAEDTKEKSSNFCQEKKMEEIEETSQSIKEESSENTETEQPTEDDSKLEKRNSDNHKSKIAAFLPDKQLWGWSGTGIRRSGPKGRAKKMYYKTIQRGHESITVGESAVFLSTGRPDRPYIGKIQSMWETPSTNKVVRVKWFYHPEETVGCPELKYPGALFESPHQDENDVQTISHKCEVLQLNKYTEKFGQDPKQYETIYCNNDTYYYAGFYDPTIQNMKLEKHIPTISKNN